MRIKNLLNMLIWKLFVRCCIRNNDQTWMVRLSLSQEKRLPHDEDITIDMNTAQVIDWLRKDGTMPDYTHTIKLINHEKAKTERTEYP